MQEAGARSPHAAQSPGRPFHICELQAWTDARVEALAAERICPATGSSVAEAWANERELLTALPQTLPDPFDAIATCTVGPDCLIAFEERKYSVPFRFLGQSVDVHGASRTVQIFKACEMVASHPRHTEHRLLLEQHHYDGPDTERVIAPPPLGRMGARIQSWP